MRNMSLLWSTSALVEGTGLAALLAMLNSCSSGVTVVNIDNGFGAACAATLIQRLALRENAS